jgi:hypothetical protein
MNGGAPDWIAEGPWTLVSDPSAAADLHWSIGPASTASMITWIAPIDLRLVQNPHVTFQSWMSSTGSTGTVEISTDMITWTTVGNATATNAWTPVSITLSAYRGEVVYLRFKWLPQSGAQSDRWLLDDVMVEDQAQPLAPVPSATPTSGVELIPVVPATPLPVEMPPALPTFELPPSTPIPTVELPVEATAEP